MEKCKMIITNVRFSYANVFEPKATPSGQMKYSSSILIPKTDIKTVDTVKKAIADAIDSGVSKGKFKKSQVSLVRSPLRDGDLEMQQEKRGNEYSGMYFFNCSSDKAPGIVGKDAKPILDENEFYSGCYGHVDVNFYPYSQAGNIGVGAGLNNVMKLKDGERLDGRQSAEKAFEAFAEIPESTTFVE
jgi:hypothetical protein